jgi:hypothetical protein
MPQCAGQTGATAGAGQPDLFAARAGVVLDQAAERPGAIRAANREQPIESGRTNAQSDNELDHLVALRSNPSAFSAATSCSASHTVAHFW